MSQYTVGSKLDEGDLSFSPNTIDNITNTPLLSLFEENKNISLLEKFDIERQKKIEVEWLYQITRLKEIDKIIEEKKKYDNQLNNYRLQSQEKFNNNTSNCRLDSKTETFNCSKYKTQQENEKIIEGEKNKELKIKNENYEIKSNYLNPAYLFLSLLSKFDDKFGSTLFIKIVIGRRIKPEFIALIEYGEGMCFGKEDWWTNFVQILKINDLIQHNQIKNSFGHTICLTENGKKWITQIKKSYPSYYILLKSNTDEKLLFESIEIPKKIRKSITKI